MTGTDEEIWTPLAPEQIAELLSHGASSWWLSGGAALDRWVGSPIRPRRNSDVSVIAARLPALVAGLPAGYSAWHLAQGAMIPSPPASEDVDPQPVFIRDDHAGAWVLQVNVEDGTDRAWVYKRDPRLQLPWDRAVLDIDGIPTGAPEVQLVWKALRPRPEDEIDKEAVLPRLSDEARSWWERAILTVHPHSTWSIHVRSPFAPAKASWNRSRR